MTGSVDNRHPLYDRYIDDWRMMRAAYEGERAVKNEGETYLPVTEAQRLDGYPTPDTPGWHAYRAYITRAVFPEYVAEAVEAMIGVMHHKPATIELPAALESLRDSATIHGESLEVLLRRITESQLTHGRLGLLLDMPAEPTESEEALPYIAMYDAEAIINWDDGIRDIGRQRLNLVVLNESEAERQYDFSWETVRKYRVLALGDVTRNEVPGEPAQYRVGVFRDDERGGLTYSDEVMRTPLLRGRPLEEIPFIFINSKDVVPRPDDPPLIGLARTCMTIYRGEADYRQALFQQGQETLVITGDSRDEDVRTGAGAAIKLPADGDAKYIGLSSQGIPEQRQAIANDRTRAEMIAASRLDAGSGNSAESGEALTIRVRSRTATLNQIALTAAFGLQSILRMAARWVGAPEESVVVTPNLDFDMGSATIDEFVKLVGARAAGGPISMRTVHEWAQNHDITELSFEEEIERIRQEDETLGADLGVMWGNSGDGPVDDDEEGDIDEGPDEADADSE